LNQNIGLNRAVAIAVVLAAIMLASAFAIVKTPKDTAESMGVFRRAPAPTVRIVNVTKYQKGGRTDSEAIQAAINAANPGDTVFFPGGRYNLDKPFWFGSGVNHVGDPKTAAVLVGRGRTSLLLKHTPSEPLHKTTIRGLQFDNVELSLSGDQSYSSFTDVTLEDCIFRNGKRSVPWSSDYLRLAYTVGVTIDGCTFLRDSRSGGRGLVLERTHSSVIKDSYFGSTRDLEDGAPNGYFRTAINLTGYDEPSQARNEDVIIDGNVWRRNEKIPCPFEAPSRCEDHGLYVWGAKDVFISGNFGDGWSNTGAGGSVKVRNSEDIFIVGNHFLRSGILAHTHWHAKPKHLERVVIADNRFDLLGNSGPGSGVVYWRSTDNELSNGSYCRIVGGEDDIVIANNRFVAGGSIDVRCAEGRKFCIEGNAGMRLFLRVPSVRTRRCAPAARWGRPLGGIHRGDFNGDGKEDFTFLANKDLPNASQWRGHMSTGDGFTNSDWGGRVAIASDTGRFGVHVGDFTGDGRDDLVYRGICGAAKHSCWRVHPSTGTRFAEPLDYGDGAHYSGETFRFGVQAGDFNGDGHDDLAFRGLCGAGKRPCWTVMTSRPGVGFAVRTSIAGSARWVSTETVEFGLLVGDYNGDGRDDLVYRTLCGSPSSPCLEVQLGITGTGTFLAQNWGNEVLPDGRYAAHFGIRVGDSNGDRKADIAYRGRCGGDSAGQWLYQLGGLRPFKIWCSRSYVFRP
jgi:hypothetical protein